MATRTLVLAMLAAWSSPAAWAATYVVDPAGNDSSAGDAQSPWRTLQHAAQRVAAGDKVVIKPGQYVGFFLTSSGTMDAPIEFLAESGAVISTRNPRTPDGINLEGASHVVIDGFEVVGMPRAGVRSVGPVVSSQQEFAEGVAIRNVVAKDNRVWGILTGFVNDLLVEKNSTSGSVEQHGIYVSNSGDRPVIRGNKVFGNNASGIQINADGNAGKDGVIEDALVSANIIYNNGRAGGSAINLDGVRNSRIENNLLYGNHAGGIALYRIDGALPSTGNTVVNNTVIQADDGRWAVSLQNGATNATLANNILLSDHRFRGALDVSSDSLPGIASNYNAVVPRFSTNGGDTVLSLAEWRQLTSQDANSFSASGADLFVDAEGGNYQLKPKSPAIGAGSNELAPKTDLLGVERPQDDQVDLGAYEWRHATGDYNRDGAIDQSDYSLWRERYGFASDTELDPADGNADGRVDAADYTIWRDSVASEDFASQAPEPAGAWVVVLGTLAVHSARRRRRSVELTCEKCE